jgi:hypothetical protein
MVFLWCLTWTVEPIVMAQAPERAEKWSEIVNLVYVPEGVGHLAVLLGVQQQTGPADLAEFDDAHLALMCQ